MARGSVGVVGDASLFDFFHERVESARAHQRAPVSDNAVFYLTNLLTEQARRGEGEPGGADPTLVELRARAVTAPPPEAVNLWRRLGDTSLVVSGFFRESLERRRISPDYYERMGAAAYRALGGLLGRRAGTLAEIFGELAERYPECVEVIAEVREEARERTDTDILKLYEEWVAKGSPRAAERLRALGVVPTRTVGNG